METRAMALCVAALVTSGAAALVYQSVWARMLHRVFGVGDQAIATVLGAFFLGMALGSFLGGRFSRRVRDPARAYALLELFIGAWALSTLVVLPHAHGLYAALAEGLGFGGLSAVRLLIATLILLPPTVAMGATLPVLMRSRVGDGSAWPRTATRLYLANTSGAILGALGTGFVLLPRLGGKISITIAAGLSVLAAALVLGAGLERADDPVDAPRENRSPPLYLGLAFATGATSLAGEVLWTRVLRILVQGTTQAFAAMLAAFLTGLVLGGALAERSMRTFRPAASLFVAQLAAAAFVAASVAAVPQLTRLLPLIVGERRLVPHEPWQLLLVSFVLLLPLAICLGASLPILFRMAGAGDAGSRTGGLLGANTLGGLFGSLAAGFVLVPLSPGGGVRNTLLGVALLHAAVALVVASSAMTRGRARAAALGLTLAVVAVIGVARPDLRLPFLLDAWHDVPRTVLEGPSASAEAPLYLREGRNTTVSVLRREGMFRLFNDGRPESGMDTSHPGFGREVALLGALPALLSERTERVMVVGLGGAHTVTTLLAGPADSIVVVELEKAVVEAARRMYDERNAIAEREVPFPLDDPRVELIVDDARARLKLSAPDSLDAVVSQPSHPWLAGSSALYTRDFFEEVDEALRDGGVFTLWVNLFRMERAPLADVLTTLRAVFPHVIAFRPDDSSMIFAASAKPLRVGARFERRLERTRLSELLRPFGLASIEGVLADLELDERAATALAETGEVLTDDLPRLEFALASLSPDASVGFGELDAWLEGVPWISSPIPFSPVDLHASIVERRLSTVRNRPVAIARVERFIEASAPTEEARAHLLGLVAERRGEVERALALYDRAGTGHSLARADALRLSLGRRRELLDVALARPSAADDLEPALRAALALDDRAALARLLSRREPRSDLTRATLLDFSERYARGGCDSVSGRFDALSRSAAPEPFRVLHDCYAERGARRDASRALVAWNGRRRRLARASYAAAGEAERGGNLGAAILRLRETEVLLPGHPGAAARLLELLVAEGRSAEAARELGPLLADAEARGDGSLEELREAVDRLGLRAP